MNHRPVTREPHALEQLLREDPDDVLSWLVYGDYLLAQGDPRGELLALELSGAYEPANEARIAALTQAQVEAIEPYARTMELEWRYGFVMAAEENTLEFPTEVERLAEFLAQPQTQLLSRLKLGFERWLDPALEQTDDPSELGDRDETIRTLALLDLRRLRSLSFAYSGAGEALAWMIAALELPHLRELDLRYCALGDAGPEALASNESLGRLQTLSLQVNGIGSDGAAALAAAHHLVALEQLDLRGNPIRSVGARALAGSPILAKLDRLYIDGFDVQPEGLEILANSRHLQPGLAGLYRARSMTHAR
jgi:uncharacterized protein (TIGR02996 family)